jgi:hypothetical protein
MQTVSTPCALAGLGHLPRLLGRKVEGQHPVDAGLARRAQVGIDAVREDEVVVGVEDDRDVARLAHAPHQLEHPRRRHPRLEGPLRRQLVGEAVGKRVRERDAELEDVRAALDHGQAGRKRRVKIRVARAQVGHERRPVLGSGAGEGFPDA